LIPVEKTRERRMDECLRKVVEDPLSIFVSPSAWEGLDLQSMGVKNAFRHVVASQLPYQSSDGAREVAIRRYLRGQGKDEKNARMFGFAALRSSALRKLKQGFGRGIRAHDDHMTFWVSDPRFPLPELFAQDISGAVPHRVVSAHQSFIWVVPKRFGDAMEQRGRVFLRNGRILMAEDVLVV
jgi:ATP-dependent DNA helicase DinG